MANSTLACPTCGSTQLTKVISNQSTIILSCPICKNKAKGKLRGKDVVNIISIGAGHAATVIALLGFVGLGTAKAIAAFFDSLSSS